MASTPVQNTYVENMAPGLPGLIVGSDYNVDTGNCETVAGLAFGIAVSQGAADKGVIIGGTRLGFRGITVRDVTLENAQQDKYAQYQNVGVLVRGKIWVAPEVAVVAGDPVHFNATTGALTNTGGQGPINGARWVTSAAGTGDLALVELSGHQRSA
jgi:hypothetical protein